MYTNIPTNELLTIIDVACQNNYVEENLKQNVIKLTKNYHTPKLLPIPRHEIQSEGLSIGAPTFSILSELYLQYLRAR